MARKHKKLYSVKSPVEKVIVKPAVVSKERIATEVPEGTEGAIPVAQDDGTTKFFVVGFKVVTPEVSYMRALRSTTEGLGHENKPENMAPKGSKMSKSAPTGGKR